MRSILSHCVISSAAILAAVAAAPAQPTQATFPTPTLDRWVYTFGGNPGSETDATVFSVLGSGFEGPAPAFPGAPVFDIRDGQMLVGYATAPTIPGGFNPNHYRIITARVNATISRDKVFRYDPTPDPFGVYLPASDPAYVPDTDPDHPVELFAVGYRNGLTAATFAENTPFSFGNPAQKFARNAFAAQYAGADGGGSLVDVSNNVQDLTSIGGALPIEARPFAIGTCTATPGAQVDLNTEYTFDVNLNDPGAIRYLRESLSGGKLNLMISSMTVTSQQSSTTPAFWTKEGPTALGAVPARLSLTVCVGAPGDWNCSGSITVQDIFDFLADYFANRGDFNADGATGVQDIFDFLAAYFAV